MIKTIFLFRTGIIAVLDDRGEQLPEFQGRYADVVERLREQDLTGADIHVYEDIVPGGLASPEQFLNLSEGLRAGFSFD